MPSPRTINQDSLRRAALRVALLNLVYFGVVSAVAVAVTSVSLFVDNDDCLKDISVNLLILFFAPMALQIRAYACIGLTSICSYRHWQLRTVIHLRWLHAQASARRRIAKYFDRLSLRHWNFADANI